MSPRVYRVANSEVVAGGNRFARGLDRAGVVRHGVVALLLANTPELLFAYRGIAWSGRRLVPMSWRWTPEDTVYVLENSEAEVLVADARFAEAALASAQVARCKTRIVVGGELPGFTPWASVEAESAEPLPDPIAGDVMMYTSGTTGRPKGVQRPGNTAGGPPETHHIGGPGRMMLEHFVSDAGAGAHLVTCPLYHAGPMTYCDGALRLGADVVLLERFDPELLLEVIERECVRSVFMVPTQFVRLLRLPPEIRQRYDLSSLQLVCHGAAPVSVDVKRRMIAWLGPVLFEFYGGSEGGGCMIGSEEWLQKPGSVGRPRPGVEVHILGEDGTAAAAGCEGDVYFNLSATPFDYKGDAQKTAEGRRGDLFTIGDVGYLDSDGYLFLCDRRADVIVSGGVNIYPAQVEAAVLELPFVADCCVVGVPDDEWGEQVRAVVQLEPEAQERTPTDVSGEIRDHCAARLSSYQVPRAVDLHPELPRTETGKLARREIRADYWKGRTRRI